MTHWRVIGVALLMGSGLALAQDDGGHAGMSHFESMPEHGHMRFDTAGIVMNANASELPRDCEALNGTYEFTVQVGTRYAAEYPGNVFGMSQHEFRVAPCSLVTVTLVNEDDIRHQWMLHGLPRYLYPQGMFHLEAAGGESVTGSFIVPGDDATYLVHCDMTQHMEKGMKAQLLVGSGNGDLWSVPGISGYFRSQQPDPVLGVPVVISMAVMSLLVMAFLSRRD